MLKLIKLEVKRNRLKGYIVAGNSITIAILAFVYLFAAIPHFDAMDTDIQIFMTYNGISILSLTILAACFSILSSTMYNKFIIEEYSSKKVFLLFSYPIPRSQVLWAKILTVFLFTTTSMIFSGMIIFGLFFITESFYPLCPDTLTSSVILEIGLLLVAYSIIAAALAVISLWFGHWKKSTSVTIVTGVIVASIFGNFSAELFLSRGITLSMVIVVIVSIMVALVLIMNLSQKVSTMEV